MSFLIFLRASLAHVVHIGTHNVRVVLTVKDLFMDSDAWPSSYVCQQSYININSYGRNFGLKADNNGDLLDLLTQGFYVLANSIKG